MRAWHAADARACGRRPHSRCRPGGCWRCSCGPRPSCPVPAARSDRRPCCPGRSGRGARQSERRRSRRRAARQWRRRSRPGHGGRRPAARCSGLGAQRRQNGGQGGLRVRLHGPRRQAVGNDEHDIIAPGVRVSAASAPARGGGRDRAASDTAAVVRRRWRLPAPAIPSLAKSAISRGSSSGSCTASRARACASLKSSSGPVASDAPVLAGRCARRSAGAGRPTIHRREPRAVCRTSAQLVSSARKWLGNSRGRIRSAESINPCRSSHASNSGAGRRPNRSRMASAS